MRVHSASPSAMVNSFWLNRDLILLLVRREVVGRYRGSFLGILWSFFNPIFMLAVYTFVFSVVFKARWGQGGGSKAEFALILYAGLLIFNLFAECITRAPSLIIGNSNYVKKVVFPLEILPWVSFGAAFFHGLVNFVVCLLFSLVILGCPSPLILLLPGVLLPLLLLTMGFSWFLAATGVFLRDVAQLVGVLTTTLMFLTPIFYPLSAIPEQYRIFLYLNPLTILIEESRKLLLFGEPPNWEQLALLTAVSFLIAWLGFAWFQKTRKGFADVL